MYIDDVLDMVRISSGKKKPKKPKSVPCSFKGCLENAIYPAIINDHKNNISYNFFLCYRHVKQYNKNYNYFKGMAKREYEEYCKQDITGHRPTWKTTDEFVENIVYNQKVRRNFSKIKNKGNIFDFTLQEFAKQKIAQENQFDKKIISPLKRKALQTLGLDTKADQEQIRQRYIYMVKRYHPDTGLEAEMQSSKKLQEVIKAYRIIIRKA